MLIASDEIIFVTVDALTPGGGNTGFRLLILHDVICCYNCELFCDFNRKSTIISLPLAMSSKHHVTFSN